MSNLKSTIDLLATNFARNILDALRSSSIDEMTGVGGMRSHSFKGIGPQVSPTSRLPRRTLTDIGKMTDAIVTLLEKHPEGLRVEHIRSELHCDQRELPRPLTDAVAAGRIVKTGQKRSTTYFAVSGKRKRK